MKVTLVNVFLVAVLFGEAEPDFISKVEKQVFEHSIMNKTCVEIAKTKMKSFHFSNEKKYAVALVNLYTQECDTTQGIFYKILNENLRSGKPAEFWKDAGNLLKEALDLLGKKTFPDLYRSCDSSVTFEKRKVYRFKAFLSTTLDKSVAEKSFGKRSHFFHIKDAKGVSISEYSQYNENEVLIEASTKYEINEVEVREVRSTKVQMTRSTWLLNIRDGDTGLCPPSDRDSGGNSGSSGGGGVSGSGGDSVSGSEIPYIKVHVMVFALIIYFC